MTLMPYSIETHTVSIDVVLKQLCYVCFEQEPTPITAMELSTKQVKTFFQHIIIYPEAVDRARSESFWAFRQTLRYENKCAY